MGFVGEIYAFVSGLHVGDHSVKLAKFTNHYGSVISIPEAVLSIALYPFDENEHEMMPPTFFQDQSNAYQAKGIKLIRIWEDVWINKQKIVESRLRSLLGKTTSVYARETVINTIDNKTANTFLDQNHLFGGSQAKFKFTLLLKGKRVAVATFSKPRNIHRQGSLFRSYELVRYCSKLDYTITGGLSKLLNYFIKIQQPDDIMTYADRDWSDGSVYNTLGFNLEDITEPQEFWIQPETNKRILSSRIGESIHLPKDPAAHHHFLTDKGFKRVYNSGNLKFVKRFK